MLKHLTPLNIALAFVALALAVHAYSAGEWATAWLMALGYASGLVSGVLVALLALERD